MALRFKQSPSKVLTKVLSLQWAHPNPSAPSKAPTTNPSGDPSMNLTLGPLAYPSPNPTISTELTTSRNPMGSPTSPIPSSTPTMPTPFNFLSSGPSGSSSSRPSSGESLCLQAGVRKEGQGSLMIKVRSPKLNAAEDFGVVQEIHLDSHDS
jgi:hypothetical protein